MTFNQLYVSELMAFKELTSTEALEYLGRAKQNGWNFYNGKTICFTPEILAKDGIIECLESAIEKWTNNLVQVEEDDFIWE